jgi:purine-binding chemotaxis protein CheW
MNEKDFLGIDTEDVENMYMVFEVAGEMNAVNISYVTEIVGMQRISAIPDMPAYIRGAINLRGKVIPVMDTRLRFGLPWREYDDRTTLIVLMLKNTPTALVVDRVTDVVTIPPENIDLPPRWQSGEKGLILGLGKIGENFSVILNVERLIEDKEIQAEQISAALQEIKNAEKEAEELKHEN